MAGSIRIKLQPLGDSTSLPAGGSLRDPLFAKGVEFPCGGRGRCKGCRIRVLAGALPVTPEDRRQLTAAELEQGWRLACRARPQEDLTLELAQWEAQILADHSEFSFVPQEGLGVAVDLGTTTLVAQLVDLETAAVLGVRVALNAQARHGADIMSRIEFAAADSGQRTLEQLVRGQVWELVSELLAVGGFESIAGPSRLRRVVIVGNTVMHHLFCGISIEPLSHVPFEPESPGLRQFGPEELGWDLPPGVEILFLPCLGGFVGSDILAGILATRLHETAGLNALLDLGTNGEIVVGDRHRLVCASTAAGPAFEGARISMGMRAATGAISEVRPREGWLECHVLGHVAPRGICGSGLVDAIAAGLDLGLVLPTGRLPKGELPLAAPVKLSQWDVRELQLAKGAIAAGLALLMEHWGAEIGDLSRVYLAGAFGNYINYGSARRIGLLALPQEKVEPVGNAALLGAKIALFESAAVDPAYPGLVRRISHLPLNEHPRFQDAYVEHMSFPPGRVEG